MSEVETQVEEQLEIAARIIADASYVIALVGAGLSKESGIPTFRGGDGPRDTEGEAPLDGEPGLLEAPGGGCRAHDARATARGPSDTAAARRGRHRTL